MLVKTKESAKLSNPIQEPVTRSEQLSCARVTAFSRTSLFLDQFWREF